MISFKEKLCYMCMVKQSTREHVMTNQLMILRPMFL